MTVLINATTMQHHLTMSGLVEALAQADRSKICRPPRKTYDLGSGTLLVMPAWSSTLAGVKLVSVFPGNPALNLPVVMGQYALSSARTGEPVGIIDGTELTLWRTAAVSALAGSRLAKHAVGSILVIGSGALVPYLISAHGSMHPQATFEIWGRSKAKARSLADALKDRYRIRAVGDLATAVGKADLVCCATSSSTPVLEGRWLTNPVHVDLVGSFTPEMREADDDIFTGASVTVDTLAAAAESGDLAQPIRSGKLAAEEIRTLEAVLSDEQADPGSARTIFKSIGCARNDLVAAEYVMSVCRNQA